FVFRSTLLNAGRPRVRVGKRGWHIASARCGERAPQPRVEGDAPRKGFDIAAPVAAHPLTLPLGVISHVAPNRSILATMKIATGKVVDGKVVLEGVSLAEGTSVTVLAEDDQGFDLTPDQEAELLLSIAEADRGETVSAEEVLAKLARR